MGWFRRNWKMLAGVACGAGSGLLAVFVNPAVGIVAAAACTGAFGAHATTLGQQLTDAALGELRAKADTAAKKEP